MDTRDQIDLFMAAISGQESGGSYEAVNKSSGAYGRFQIMPSNWPSWAGEALGDRNASRTAANQDAVAKFKFLQYFDTWGDWDAVAIAWFAGPSRADKYKRGDLSVLNISDGGMTVRAYVAKMRQGMSELGAVGVPGTATTPVGAAAKYVPEFAPAVAAIVSGTELRPRDFTPSGRLAAFTLNNFAVSADIVNAVIGTPTLELTAQEASELSFEVSDPQMALLASGALAAMTQLTYLDLTFEVVTLELDGTDTPTISIKAQPLGLSFLKRATGALVVADTSSTDFARVEAEAAGLAFVGEPTEPHVQITRAAPTGFAPDAGGKNPENSWEVIKALAQELGFITFVSGNTLYYGRATWLMARPGVTTWTLRYPTPNPGGEIGAYTVPKCRHSIASGIWTTEITVDVDPATGNSMRPGDRLDLRGIPSFETEPDKNGYLIVNVTVSFDPGTPTTVRAVTPIDPLPPRGAEHTDVGSVGAAIGTSVTDSGTFIWPVQGPITSGFGPRQSPGGIGSTNHKGIDISAAGGTPVKASRAGVVTQARLSPSLTSGYGRLVELEHEDGTKTRYGHLQEWIVQEGQHVGQGQLLGLVDSTGTSTGNHLHFEILVNGTQVDPIPYLPKI